MHTPLRLHGSNMQQSSRYFAILQIPGNFLHWLIGLIRLTEEEKKDAGIYLGNQTR